MLGQQIKDLFSNFTKLLQRPVLYSPEPPHTGHGPLACFAYPLRSLDKEFCLLTRVSAFCSRFSAWTSHACLFCKESGNRADGPPIFSLPSAELNPECCKPGVESRVISPIEDFVPDLCLSGGGARISGNYNSCGIVSFAGHEHLPKQCRIQLSFPLSVHLP